MIVSERFKNDKTDFQWAQHDQYSKAIEIIFDHCRKHYLEHFKDDHENEIVPPLRNLNSFDHRVLQDFHDHLAAHWRKKYLRMDSSTEENVIVWLSWLEKEMREFKKMSQIYVGVCFLALDRYDKDHEKRIVEFIQRYAQKTYPLKWQHYLKRISAEDTMNVIYACAILIFSISALYSGILYYEEMPSMLYIFGFLFSAGYIYTNNKKLHDLCMKNVFIFLMRLLLIFACSFLIALLVTGFYNFQKSLILNHIAEVATLMACVTSLHLIKQLYFNR